MVWAITNYYIETPSGLKDFVTSDEVENLIANIDCGGNIEEKSIPLDKIGWIRIGERVYEGSLGEEYRMSEYVDIRG